MSLHQLPKVTAKSHRRLGQGSGSGRGKTAGRGTKGQKARGKIRQGFEGGQLRLIKRLPFNRGKNRNAGYRSKAVVVNVAALELLPINTIVTADTLVKYRIIKNEDGKQKIKILGDGNISKSFIVRILCSKGAVKKIEKAGGSVENFLQGSVNQQKKERTKSTETKVLSTKRSMVTKKKRLKNKQS